MRDARQAMKHENEIDPQCFTSSMSHSAQHIIIFKYQYIQELIDSYKTQFTLTFKRILCLISSIYTIMEVYRIVTEFYYL